VIAEPGRYFVASAFTLATCVHSKREVLDELSRQVLHVMYYIDDGVFGSFNEVISYDEHSVPSTLSVSIVIVVIINQV
jgi:ornithine decarboxylase